MEVSRRIRAYMELQGMVPMEMAAALQMWIILNRLPLSWKNLNRETPHN